MPKAIYTEIELPEIVRKANTLANQLNFPLMPEGRAVGYQGPPSACIPQVGRLLQVLAILKAGINCGFKKRRTKDLVRCGHDQTI